MARWRVEVVYSANELAGRVDQIQRDRTDHPEIQAIMQATSSDGSPQFVIVIRYDH